MPSHALRCPEANPDCPGMAGSGKTTLLQRITAELQQRGEPGYVLNLDPAVTEVPYGANIDIRDTVRALPHAQCMQLQPLCSRRLQPVAPTALPGAQVNYKNVMKQYNLGPNGGILTSLNLFATRFDQVRRRTG